MTYLEALQDTLSAEHAAVYVVAVLGAQTSQTDQPDLYTDLTQAYGEHREARNLLEELVREQDGIPVAAETAYALPEDLSRSADVVDLALEVQRAVAASYARLSASSSGLDRRWPIQRLQATAVRELAFGGRLEAFPGSEEYAARS